LLAKKISSHQTVTYKFFFKTVGQHWFPNKSHFDQFIYICFLAVNFVFECPLGISYTFNVFQSHFLTPNSLYGICCFHFVQHFTLPNVHLHAEFRVTQKPMWQSAAPNIIPVWY